MRSGSVTWLSVAGPLAQFRPRLPGCAGLPSNFWILSVRRSTYASSPHAGSQLKQLVGMSEYCRSTRRGHSRGSNSSQLSQSAAGGQGYRPSTGAWRSRATGWSGSVTRSVMGKASAQGDGLTRADPEIFVEPEAGEGQARGDGPPGGPGRHEQRDGE